MMSRTWRTEGRWLTEPDLSAWVAKSRLNLLRALPDHAAEPSVQAAVKRYLAHVGTAIERLTQLDASSSASVKGPAQSARMPGVAVTPGGPTTRSGH
jgi:predicted component of type VI protein secretion system